MPGALEGVRVLDLAQGVGGPYTAMLLAEQRAEVLKVEPPTRDRLRNAAAYHTSARSGRGQRLLVAGRRGSARQPPIASIAPPMSGSSSASPTPRVGWRWFPRSATRR